MNESQVVNKHYLLLWCEHCKSYHIITIIKWIYSIEDTYFHDFQFLKNTYLCTSGVGHVSGSKYCRIKRKLLLFTSVLCCLYYADDYPSRNLDTEITLTQSLLEGSCWQELLLESFEEGACLWNMPQICCSPIIPMNNVISKKERSQPTEENKTLKLTTLSDWSNLTNMLCCNM